MAMLLQGFSTLVEYSSSPVDLQISSSSEEASGIVADLPASPTSFSGTGSLGWHSPRLSFSSSFSDRNRGAMQQQQEEVSAEISGRPDAGELWHEEDDHHPVGADFEFCMATSSTVDRLSGCGSMLKPADELFHKGKIRPFSLPSRNQATVEAVLDLQPMIEEEGQQPRQPNPSDPFVGNSVPLERSMSISTPVSSRCSDFASTGSNPSVAKSAGGGWREVFGLLRRARSDGTRCWPSGAAAPVENNSRPPVAFPTCKASATSQKQQAASSFTGSSSFKMLFKRPTSSVEHGAVVVEQPRKSLSGSSTAAELVSLESNETQLVPPPQQPSQGVTPAAPSRPWPSSSSPASSRPRPSSSSRRHRSRSLVSSQGYVNSFFKKDSMERELLGGSSGYASPRRLNPPGSRVVMRKLDNNMRDGVQFYQTTATSSVSSTTPSAKIVLRNLERCSTASTSGKQIATIPKPQENHNLTGASLQTHSEVQQIAAGGPKPQENHINLSSRSSLQTWSEIQEIAAAGPKPQENYNPSRSSLRSRGEIRRSLDLGGGSSSSSYSSNVRVAPVLNLPQVCIGPGIRTSSISSSASSSKAGHAVKKGHLARLRSLLFFKKVNAPAECNPPVSTPLTVAN
ncbi:unnamed protein product [Sphagnum troendelagicum]|uniref:Uncharacterized protein n=1 Tax=Sphagnum troendelagicum TaxID=128251 RepID=A0ABP0TQJ0_9BRYO